MLNAEKYEELHHKAILWLWQHQSFDAIRERLIKEGADELTAAEITKEVKLIFYARKRQKGSMIILTGSLLLLAGFLLTISNFYANTSFTYVMYGFTTVGLLVIFYGLYEIFG